MKSTLSPYRQFAAHLVAGIAMVGVLSSAASAYDFQALHTFSTSDGKDPSGLTRDASGNLYGGTQSGGTFGQGTIFKITPDGTFTSLYSFQPLEAIYPTGTFIVDASGNITGEAAFGGPFFSPSSPGSGGGVLFHLTSTGTFSSLLNFDYNGGSNPFGGLISDSAGNLYGVNLFGGSVGPGGIFKYSAGGVHTLLHSFNGADGNEPTTALVRTSDGTLYGTTQNGGDTSDSGHSGYGTVWKLSSTNVLTTLHQFHGTDGSQPQGALVRDAAGNLYGTAGDGANVDLYTGGGLIYKIDTTGTFSVLHQFIGADGYSPAGGLVVDAAGNLYGTTKYGGNFSSGEVFRLDTNGQITVLHSFSDTDLIGAHPQGTLLADSTGNLFGMTLSNSVSVGGIFRVALYNIDSFAPSTGTVGTHVILKGSYFTGTTSVKFSGVSAAFTVDSDTQITATVPSGAITGKITIAKADATTVSATNFSMPPSLGYFDSYVRSGGLRLWISGVNLTGATSVTVAGVPVTSFTVDSNTTIEAVMPIGGPSGPITVTTPSGMASSSRNFNPNLTATSFSPAFGKAADVITIAGTGLTGATKVMFGSINAAFHIDSDTQITATVPAGVATDYIYVSFGQIKARPDNRFFVSPTIASFTPGTSTVSSDVNTLHVVITGTNFQQTSSVKFNGVASYFWINSASQITALLPNGATTGKITVTGIAGTATSSSNFTVTY